MCHFLNVTVLCIYLTRGADIHLCLFFISFCLMLFSIRVKCVAGQTKGATEGNPVIFVVCDLDDYSGFRPNECFIVFNSFLKIIPVDPCSLYESTMNICFYF